MTSADEGCKSLSVGGCVDLLKDSDLNFFKRN